MSPDFERFLLENVERLETLVRAKTRGQLHRFFTPSDLVQESLLEASQNETILMGTSPLHAQRWLATVCKSKMLDQVRHAMRRRDRACIEAELARSTGRRQWETPSGTLMREELLIALTAAVDALPADQRQAIQAYYIDVRGMAETARLMDRSPRAVHQLLLRARVTLRDRLEPSSRPIPSPPQRRA